MVWEQFSTNKNLKWLCICCQKKNFNIKVNKTISFFSDSGRRNWAQSGIISCTQRYFFLNTSEGSMYYVLLCTIVVCRVFHASHPKKSRYQTMPKNLAPNYDTKENQHVRCHWEIKGGGGGWLWGFFVVWVFFKSASTC